MRNKSVAFIYPYSFQYRAPFNERVRQILGERGVDYDVIYSSDPRMARPSGDLVSLPWASDVGCRLLKIGGKQLRYQQALSKALSKDLVILQQENGLLVNYALQMAAPFLRLKTAFFGHGKNFQVGASGQPFRTLQEILDQQSRLVVRLHATVGERRRRSGLPPGKDNGLQQRH